MLPADRVVVDCRISEYELVDDDEASHVDKLDAAVNTSLVVVQMFPSLCFSQGRHLKRGSRRVDFDINLRDSECDPVSLTDNQVECRPSEDIRNINFMNCPDETLSADVSIYFLCSEAVSHIVR